MFRFKKRHLYGRHFGKMDMATLAESLYRCYHEDNCGTLGNLEDRDVRDDRTVHDFLRYAYYLCDLAEVDADAGRGSVYYQ
jgi:hypothetical protein